MNCGDILLVSYQFTDASGSKLRPVLVISVDEFNQGDDLIVTPISSAPSPMEPQVFSLPDTSPFFANTGLRRSSSVKWTKVLTISRRVVSRKLGRLPTGPLTEIQHKVRSLFGD